MTKKSFNLFLLLLVFSVLIGGLFLFYQIKNTSAHVEDVSNNSKEKSPSLKTELPKVGDIANSLQEGKVPISESDNPDYDFMAVSPLGFKVYFKKELSTSSPNVKFQASDNTG